MTHYVLFFWLTFSTSPIQYTDGPIHSIDFKKDMEACEKAAILIKVKSLHVDAICLPYTPVRSHG